MKIYIVNNDNYWNAHKFEAMHVSQLRRLLNGLNDQGFSVEISELPKEMTKVKGQPKYKRFGVMVSAW